MADDDTDGVIPESKIREAHAKCMEDPQLAKYFNDAPQGAKEYIALMFYCTVFQNEVDDTLYETYQKEVEEEMSREDILYLATHDRNPQSKAHFRDLLAQMPVTPPPSVVQKSDEATSVQVQQVSIDTRRIEMTLERVQTSLLRIQTTLEEREKREAKLSKIRTICALVFFSIALLLVVAGAVVLGVYLLSTMTAK